MRQFLLFALVLTMASASLGEPPTNADQSIDPSGRTEQQLQKSQLSISAQIDRAAGAAHHAQNFSQG